MFKIFKFISVFCAVAAFGANAQNNKLVLQNIDHRSISPAGTEVSDIPGMKVCDDAAMTSATPAQAEKAPARTMAMGDEAEWTLIGTAHPNDRMVGIFNYNFGTVEDKDYPVYFKPVSETSWNFKIKGLFNCDVIINSSLTGATFAIDQMATGLVSPLADNEGYYPFYEIWIPKIEGTPFDGEIDFNGYVLVADNRGYSVDGSYGMKISFDFGVTDVFGTMRPSDNLCDELPNYGVTVENKVYDVYKKTVNKDVLLYRIPGFMGNNAYIVSYPEANHSVYVAVNTLHPTYFDGDNQRLYYTNFRAYAYFLGSPDSRNMPFPIWLNVAVGYGYDLSSRNYTLIFSSPEIPTLEKITNIVTLRPGENKAAIKVEHSDNVTQVRATLYEYRIDLETHRFKMNELSTADYTIDANSEFTVPVPEVRGIYGINFYGLKNGYTFGNTKVVEVSKTANDAHTWKSIGTGLVKLDFLQFCYPDEVATWLTVPVEKATDTDNLYRLVNPYSLPEIVGRTQADTTDNYYIYFGEGADYSVYQPCGMWSQYGHIYGMIYGVKAESGRYDLNTCSITLPGIDNYDIVFVNDKEAVPTPMVKKVKYAVIPAKKGIAKDLGTDAKRWIEEDKPALTELTPVNGRLTFERDLSEINLLVTVSLDDKGAARDYISALTRCEEGWYKAGTAVFGQFSANFCDSTTESVCNVYVNPFDRRTVLLEEPFKGLASNLKDGLHADFSKKRNVILYTSPEPYNYLFTQNFDPDEEMFSGMNIGIYIDDDPDNSQVAEYERYKDYYTRYSLETETTLLYRSNFKDSDIAADENLLMQVPYRVGSLLVFPVSSIHTSCILRGWYWNTDVMTIYAPTSFDVNHSMSDDSPTNGIFAVGEDISRVRVYYEPADVQTESTSAMSKTVDDVIKDETLGVYIDVADGKTSKPFADNPGRYSYIAIGYQPDGQTANVLTGTTQISSGIDDILIPTPDPAPVYYNLQGVRIEKPVPGTLIIERRGAKTTKTVYRD